VSSAKDTLQVTRKESRARPIGASFFIDFWG
jgi:hypothetical protein